MQHVERWCFGAIMLLSTVTLQGQTGSSPVPVARGKQDTAASNPQSTKRTAGAADSNGKWLQPGEDPDNRLVSPFLKHMVADQKQFWTSPARFRTKDLKWIVPGLGITAAFIASDSWWSKQVN